jgi:hypothetical protein
MKDKIQIFLVAVLLSVLFIIGFSACTGQSTNNIEQSAASDEMLIVIEDHALSGYYIVYDKDTKIIYYQGVSHGACLNPLYNPDGTLKLYNGGKS